MKEYAYLVFCNPEPIFYGAFKKKQDAVRYALSLIRYRRSCAQENGYKFGFIHFDPYISEYTLKQMHTEDAWENKEALVFSACLRVEDNLADHLSNNACKIKVSRVLVRDTYK